MEQITKEVENILKKFRVNVNAPNLLEELFDAIPQVITVDNIKYWFEFEKLDDGSWRLEYIDVHDDEIIATINDSSLQKALIAMFVNLNEILKS